MKVVYKKWNDGEGLEEAQEKIYREASGLPATAWQIKERNIQRGSELTRYALTEDGKPLAYVTSNTDFDRKEALIGYPWAMSDCPPEAQEKIFNEQLEYLEGLDNIDAIMTGVVCASKISDEQVEWFEERGFTREDSIFRYIKNFDVEDTSKHEVGGKASKLTSKIATEDDIDALVELCLADENVRNAFADEEGFQTYFKERVFSVQSPVMILDGDEAVAATAPLRYSSEDGPAVVGDEDRIIMRFQAIRPGYEYVWSKLFVEFAKYCKKIGWTDLKIQSGFGFTSSETQTLGFSHLLPELGEFEIRLFKRKE